MALNWDTVNNIPYQERVFYPKLFEVVERKSISHIAITIMFSVPIISAATLCLTASSGGFGASILPSLGNKVFVGTISAGLAAGSLAIMIYNIYDCNKLRQKVKADKDLDFFRELLNEGVKTTQQLAKHYEKLNLNAKMYHGELAPYDGT